MSMLQILKKWNQNLTHKSYSSHKYNVGKFEKYLSSFPEPNDLIERSYYQNKCQNKQQGILVTLLNNFAAFWLLIPFILLLLYKSKKALQADEIFDAAATFDFRRKGLLPRELDERYKKIALFTDVQGCLKKDDIKYIKGIFLRYPVSFYFLFKNMCMIASYSLAIYQYRSSAIFTYGEYSFTSSILTWYCQSKNVKHVNIMHGEKIFNIRDSFFIFDRFYVWDKHYIHLFVRLRADDSQFIVTPLRVLDIPTPCSTQLVDYKYYLQAHTEEQLRQISTALKILKGRGQTISVRLHPSYSKMNIVNYFFETEDIEDPKLVSIENSLSCCNNVVSVCSTVLQQAYQVGIQCVIDDISNPDEFRQLIERDYIMMKKRHKLLSRVVNEE